MSQLKEKWEAFLTRKKLLIKRKHWNKIFASNPDPALGWYESDVSQTLKFLNQIPKAQASTVFLAGAGTSLLVDELIAAGHKLVLNDISDEALHKLKERVGTNDYLTWLHQDISQPLPEGTPLVDVWIDRAVLHFLLEEAHIQRYFTNLRTTVKLGGYALLAEFSTMGARKCAGLKLHRYSIEEMINRMGPEFRLIRHENHTYVTPAGDSRPYLYALFEKHR